jgi:hypothetical protein
MRHASGDSLSQQDLELRGGVRNALTRHWIDLSKTNFLVRRGHVELSGEAAVVGAQRSREDTAQALKAFESDVRRLKEVKSVHFDFTNWVREDSGEWTSRRGEPAPQSSEQNGQGTTSESVNES